MHALPLQVAFFFLQVADAKLVFDAACIACCRRRSAGCMDTACNLHADGPHDAADAMQVACGVHATCSKKNASCRGKVCWVHWLHLQVAFLKMQLARGASACCICASATCGHFTCRLQTLYLQVADVLSAGCRKVACNSQTRGTIAAPRPSAPTPRRTRPRPFLQPPSARPACSTSRTAPLLEVCAYAVYRARTYLVTASAARLTCAPLVVGVT